MAVILGKLKTKIFENDDHDYHIYSLRVHGGSWETAIYNGDNEPKTLKTIEYALFGEWKSHYKYGTQFHIDRFERAETASQSDINEINLRHKASRHLG